MTTYRAHIITDSDHKVFKIKAFDRAHARFMVSHLVTEGAICYIV